ncbi:Dabb family protein [Saccharopolyspora sp. HNM0983]|uniref:Dabb family protein n=1 Tax=Saccharopolyspora montiporae TaxID=2781240 RepID=A0A929B6S0_9PSEU|nr:Dabb family protein [Saccharopolyspora sp. HNM0983]MBE9372865.1 Dabb family protein [Saccharopolyspora sp. HNM0983]
MIRHVVLFRWKPDFDPTEWFAAVRGLQHKIPEVKELSLGADVLHADRSWDAAIVADFDRIEDVAVYTAHPEHQPAVELSRAGAEQIISVDFELPEDAR